MPMRTDIWYDSCGVGQIHACKWMPEGEPKAVLQIIHGISEYVERYDAFANYLTERGFVVVAEDHMGHGKSVNGDGIPGYFTGGWFRAVEDSYRLLRDTRKEYPEIPYVLLGHSMGSFMTRTILYQHPDSGISAAIICGTGWQPAAAMPAAVKFMELACKKVGETNPSEKLHDLIFGKYNARVDHPKTAADWVCRDSRIVENHPMLSGALPTSGLLRDMIIGVSSVERMENLAQMNKELPVYFVAGGEDPVGSYGKGVKKCADAFRKAGMQDVTLRVYPLCRHEILNEINCQEVFENLVQWVDSRLKKTE